MRAVAFLTVAGIAALVLARLTGSTPLAVLAVGMAVGGIVLLLRDWRAERGRMALEAPLPEDGHAGGQAQHELSPDEFSPDISTDPDGPSSDARAD